MPTEDKKKLLNALKIGRQIQETTLVLDQNQCEFLYENLKNILEEEI